MKGNSCYPDYFLLGIDWHSWIQLGSSSIIAYLLLVAVVESLSEVFNVVLIWRHLVLLGVFLAEVSKVLVLVSWLVSYKGVFMDWFVLAFMHVCSLHLHCLNLSSMYATATQSISLCLNCLDILVYSSSIMIEQLTQASYSETASSFWRLNLGADSDKH